MATRGQHLGAICGKTILLLEYFLPDCLQVLNIAVYFISVIVNR